MATQKRPVGTGYVNLSRVLEANRPAAQRMGQSLASEVSQQGAAAQAGITSGQQRYNMGLGDAVTVYDQDADYETSKARAQGAYEGPKSWEDAGVNTAALTSQVNTANDRANALTSQGGRAALLREKNPGATAGGLALDAFLAGQGAGAQLQQARSQYGGLSAALAQARGEATGAYQGAVDLNRRAREGYAENVARIDRGNWRNELDATLERNAMLLQRQTDNLARERARNNQLNDVEEIDRRDRKRGRFGEDYEP